MPERVPCQPSAVSQCEAAGPHLLQQPVITRRVDHYGDIGVVLRGGTDHRGATDVDLLNTIVHAGP